jgi:lipopolysaccharide/colanic/teichoic acid biosynthesis glycosyltransferase
LYWTRRPWYERRGHAWIEGRAYESVKRGVDLAGGIVLLPATLVALGLCWMAIKLDSPGPAFFTQVRTGRGGKRFRMFKLRTMVRDAEALKSSYMHLNQLAYPDFKIAHDPRITRVGRILRKTSLDELPQVFNVLQGVMSLVGPRPTSFSSETYRLWHTVRLELKPGMTGLWQVSGRNELDFDDRVRLDVAYLRNRCLALDLKILARTFLAVFRGRGAN